jgi:predicted transcriptional regulator
LYKPVAPREQTKRRLTKHFLQHVFDGAIDQLVETVFSHRTPTETELERLEELLAEARKSERNRTEGRERRRT